MKTPLLPTLLLALVCLLSQAAEPPASSPSSAAASDTAEAAIAIKNGAPYLVQHDQAFRLDPAEIPEGKMLSAEGQTIPLPANVTGFDTTASASGSTSAAEVSADSSGQSGVTFRDGSPYLVRNGQATRIDAAALGDNQMMTFEGQQAPIPTAINLDTAGSLSPGTVTPGRVTPGRVEGGSVRGPDVKGADVRGADVRGADVRGADVRGADVRGADVRGGDVSR